MPTWAGVQTQAFTAGLGIVELSAAFLFAFLIGFVLLRRLFTSAGI